MELIKKIMPMLWSIIEKKKCAINVSTIEDKLIINILTGRRNKVFQGSNHDVVMGDLRDYIAAM